MEKIGGWFGIATAAVAIYIGFAKLFNETAGRVRLHEPLPELLDIVDGSHVHF